MHPFKGYVFLLAAAAITCGCSRELLTDADVVRATAVAQLVEQDRLQGHVEALVQVRATEEPELHTWPDELPLFRTSTSDYFAAQLREFGREPVIEVSEDQGITVANIFVDVPGTERPDELVLITAHYDSWFLGADDNASGIAVLLECARILTQASPPARTIRILAFDREEEGLLGSHRYFDAHRQDRVISVINLDAVGYTDPSPGSQMSIPGVRAPDTGDFLALIASADGESQASRVAALSSRLPEPIHVVGLITPNDSRYPAFGDLLRSDHAWFWQAGIPALFFTDTADFRNPNYHTDTDLPETLDYDFLERVAQLTIGAAAMFADGIQ